jgi:hypothetical protein
LEKDESFVIKYFNFMLRKKKRWRDFLKNWEIKKREVSAPNDAVAKI